MKKILSMFDSLMPADLIAIVCVCVIGAFLFVIVAGCGDDTTNDNKQTTPQDAPKDNGPTSAQAKDDGTRQPKVDQDEEEITVSKRGILGDKIMDFQCQNNLKNIKIALIQYECTYKRLPDRGGDLFLAKLYLVGYVNKWDVFICPADVSSDKAGFVLSEIEKKCPPPDGKWHEYEDYMDPDYAGEPKKSPYDLDQEAQWKMSNQTDRTFKPGEISYAAVWNRHGSQQECDLECEGWERKYEIKSIASYKRKPVVCDDFENENGNEDEEGLSRLVHGDHVNVLYSNGDVDSVSGLENIGDDSNLPEFKALRN